MNSEAKLAFLEVPLKQQMWNTECLYMRWSYQLIITEGRDLYVNPNLSIDGIKRIFSKNMVTWSVSFLTKKKKCFVKCNYICISCSYYFHHLAKRRAAINKQGCANSVVSIPIEAHVKWWSDLLVGPTVGERRLCYPIHHAVARAYCRFKLTWPTTLT